MGSNPKSKFNLSVYFLLCWKYMDGKCSMNYDDAEPEFPFALTNLSPMIGQGRPDMVYEGRIRGNLRVN